MLEKRLAAIRDDALVAFLLAIEHAGLPLVSCFVVGSFAEQRPPQRWANDLDMRAVVERVTSDGLRRIATEMDSFARSTTDDELDVETGSRIGIERGQSDSRSLLLHWIVLRPEDLTALPATHLRGYARRYLLVAGEDVLRPYREIALSAGEVLDAPEGIRACKTMISDGSLQYAEWDTRDPVPEIRNRVMELDTPLLWECCNYAVHHCSMNTRVLLQDDVSSSEFADDLLDHELPALQQALAAYESGGCREREGMPSIDQVRQWSLAYLEELERLILAQTATG